VAKAKGEIVVSKDGDQWEALVHIKGSSIAIGVALSRGRDYFDTKSTALRAANRLAAATGLPVIVED